MTFYGTTESLCDMARAAEVMFSDDPVSSVKIMILLMTLRMIIMN